MKRALLVTASILAVAGLVWAGQEKGGQEGPQMPKLSKEHEALKEMEGTWDIVMKFRMGPEAPEQEAKGVETVTMVGGFWAVFDIKFAEMMGASWHAHGSLGYDPDKKKYVGTFCHSAAPYLHLGEGTRDAAGKVITMNWEGIGHSGQKEKMREVFEKKDKDHAVMTMYGTGPDGKEMVHFTSTYTRKK